jgi:hypothetical protein
VHGIREQQIAEAPKKMYSHTYRSTSLLSSSAVCFKEAMLNIATIETTDWGSSIYKTSYCLITMRSPTGEDDTRKASVVIRKC